MLGISLTVLFSALAAFAVWSYYINPALKSNVIRITTQCILLPPRQWHLYFV